MIDDVQKSPQQEMTEEQKDRKRKLIKEIKILGIIFLVVAIILALSMMGEFLK